MKSEKANYAVEIPSILNELITVEKLAEKVADKHGMSEEDRDNVAISVTEAVNNAIVHGNGGITSKKVYVEFTVSGNELKISVKDEGGGFDPSKLGNPLAPENLLKESGRGIFILKALIDKVNFTFSSKGKIITMFKKI